MTQVLLECGYTDIEKFHRIKAGYVERCALTLKTTSASDMFSWIEVCTFVASYSSSAWLSYSLLVFHKQNHSLAPNTCLAIWVTFLVRGCWLRNLRRYGRRRRLLMVGVLEFLVSFLGFEDISWDLVIRGTYLASHCLPGTDMLTLKLWIAMCIRAGKQGIWRNLGSYNRLYVQMADDSLSESSSNTIT